MTPCSNYSTHLRRRYLSRQLDLSTLVCVRDSAHLHVLLQGNYKYCCVSFASLEWSTELDSITERVLPVKERLSGHGNHTLRLSDWHRMIHLLWPRSVLVLTCTGKPAAISLFSLWLPYFWRFVPPTASGFQLLLAPVSHASGLSQPGIHLYV
ncbi:hypothetical protein BC628DRAFT_1343115 [Trametes gibbosa]|nr:hypothetical protein BC628DRAFT_1343115 [Trametes gibbosa]